MRQRIWVIGAIAALYLMVAGCVQNAIEPQPMPDADRLEDVNWRLVSYATADNVEVAALPNVEAFIQFNAGEMGGSVGCNSFSGSYTVSEDNGTYRISFGAMATTLMGCPEAIMQQEQDVTAALSESASYTIQDDILRLYSEDGQLLATFAAAPATALAGPTWTATGYNNGRGGFTSLIQDTEITAIFGEDGVLSGSAGCNNYHAPYEVNGDTIQIGPAASTRMFCATPEGVMQQEAEYLAALPTAAVYQAGADTLEMRTAEGALVAAYRLADSIADDGEGSVASWPGDAISDSLVGPLWKWQGSQYGNDTDATPADPDQYTVQFDADGNVSVQADCNRVNGAYEADGSSITITLTATTMAMCPEGSLEQEFLRDLSGAAIYFFDEDGLYIDIMMDAGTMRFAQ